MSWAPEEARERRAVLIPADAVPAAFWPSYATMTWRRTSSLHSVAQSTLSRHHGSRPLESSERRSRAGGILPPELTENWSGTS